MEITLAYIHLVGVILIFVSLFLELSIISKIMTPISFKKLARADALYGIASLIMLSTGFMRVYLTGKGSEYYWDHQLFLIKLSLFIVVGIISIYPTVQFLKLNKRHKTDDSITWNEASRFKKIVILEIVILFFIPLLATFIARGIGF